jgi:hypothetical protein
MALWDAIREIWLDTAGIDPDCSEKITKEDKDKVYTEAILVPRYGVYYGNNCGPGTRDGPPALDALDLVCKCHDTFFYQNPKVDEALQKSAAYLADTGMVTGQETAKYVKKMNSQTFIVGGRMWRMRSLLFNVCLLVVSSSILLYILLNFKSSL